MVHTGVEILDLCVPEISISHHPCAEYRLPPTISIFYPLPPLSSLSVMMHETFVVCQVAKASAKSFSQALISVSQL